MKNPNEYNQIKNEKSNSSPDYNMHQPRIYKKPENDGKKQTIENPDRKMKEKTQKRDKYLFCVK